MDFLKKWTSCITSFVVGVLGLLLSLCTGMTNSVNVSSDAIAAANTSSSEATKAYKMLTDSALADQAETYGVSVEFGWLKAFAIIMMVISILLVVYSVIMLLKNLNVIKSDNMVFDIIGYILAALVAIAVIGLVVTSFVYANAIEAAVIDMLKLQFATMISLVTIDVSVTIGVYQWIMLFVGLISAIASTTFTILKRKSA